MQRVLFTAMSEVDGKYWYRDAPFTGVGFFAGEDCVGGYWVNVGVLEKEYAPITCKTPFECRQLDLTGVLSDYELILQNGEPFTGVGYEFSDEFCIHEAYVSDGVIISDAYWNADGLMLHLGLDSGVFGEIYEWNLNGGRKSIDISTGASFAGHFAYTQDGKLRYLNSNRGFLDALDGISKVSRYFPYGSLEDIFKSACEKNMILAGNDMNDASLMSVVYFLGSRFLEVLELRDTKVEDFNFNLLLNLRELRVSDRKNDRSGFASTIKAENPKLRVFFNERECLIE